jgi:formate-dependent phosphoribosylglycinamide formyltransferase (GAR transformylase)
VNSRYARNVVRVAVSVVKTGTEKAKLFVQDFIKLQLRVCSETVRRLVLNKAFIMPACHVRHRAHDLQSSHTVTL